MNMFPVEHILFFSAILLLLSVFLSKVGDKMAIPALLTFILIGVLAGSEGVGGIYFDDPWLVKFIGIIALNFVMFSGGIDTSWEHMRTTVLPAFCLATVGVIITAVITGLFAVRIMGFTLLEGLLLGSIVSSTDASATFSILRSRHIRLKGRLQPLLELESGSNDPMAVFLTVGILGLIAVNGNGMFSLVPTFFLDISIGFVVGYVMAMISTYLMNNLRLGYSGLYPVMTVALVLMTYAVTTIIKGNGFIAVYLVGLLMSKQAFSHKKNIQKFHEGLAWLMQVTMFLALGLLVFPSQALQVALPGILMSAVLIFLARPISVFVCLAPFKISFVEKLLISWVGLKGVAAVILAVFPLLTGMSQAGRIFNVVFIIVLTSIFVQGTSIPSIARLLRLDTTEKV